MEHLLHFKEEIEFLFTFWAIGSNDSQIVVAHCFATFGNDLWHTSAKAPLPAYEGIHFIEALDINWGVGIAPWVLGPKRTDVFAPFLLKPKAKEDHNDGDHENKRCHVIIPFGQWS
tara:strand:+ start:513 stop:860 length:348 start_codon:yes stop_codon:yes gene_type:complete